MALYFCNFSAVERLDSVPPELGIENTPQYDR